MAVDVIIGTTFMNKNVKAIECMKRRIRFRDDGYLPVLSADTVTTPARDAHVQAKSGENGTPMEAPTMPSNFDQKTVKHTNGF